MLCFALNKAGWEGSSRSFLLEFLDSTRSFLLGSSACGAAAASLGPWNQTTNKNTHARTGQEDNRSMGGDADNDYHHNDEDNNKQKKKNHNNKKKNRNNNNNNHNNNNKTNATIITRIRNKHTTTYGCANFALASSFCIISLCRAPNSKQPPWELTSVVW